MNYSIDRRASGSAGYPVAGLARKGGLGLVGAGLLAMLGACVRPEPVIEPEPVPRCELPSLDGGRKYVVEAWALPDPAFSVGEPLRLQMRSSSPAYLNVFYVSTSCKVTRLLHDHRVRAAEIVDFPLAASGLRMTVKPPPGDEVFHFVATRDRLDFLSPAEVLGEAAGIANLDLSPAQFHERLADARSRINPDDWSATSLRTSVVGH